MPRTYLTQSARNAAAAARADTEFKALVSAQLVRKGRDYVWLAQGLGVSRVTMYRKMGNPGTLTVEQVRKIACLLGADSELLCKSLGWSHAHE